MVRPSRAATTKKGCVSRNFASQQREDAKMSLKFNRRRPQGSRTGRHRRNANRFGSRRGGKNDPEDFQWCLWWVQETQFAPHDPTTFFPIFFEPRRRLGQRAPIAYAF